MRPRTIFVLVAIAFASAACSVVASFDGLVGDAPDRAADNQDASTLDGSSPLTDGTAPSDAQNSLDASADGALTDGTTTPVGDGAPTQFFGTGGAFCTTDASTILLCDDFDQSIEINGNVWDINNGGTGNTTIDTRSYWSAPNAFLGVLAQQSNGDNYQGINGEIPFGTGRFKTEFKFYLDFDATNTAAGSNTNSGAIVELYFENDVGFCSLYFGKTTFSMEVDTYTAGSENDLTVLLGKAPTAGWHAVEIDSVFSATATGSIVVTMDGTQLTSQASIANLAPDSGAPQFEPTFGIENYGKVGTTYLYIDDVRVSSF